MGTLVGKVLSNWLLSSSILVFAVQIFCWFWAPGVMLARDEFLGSRLPSQWFRPFHYLAGVLRWLLPLLYLFLNMQNFFKDTQLGMSIILYKYHNTNLGPLLQTCKCRVQSSSTVIYAMNNYFCVSQTECEVELRIEKSSHIHLW